MIIRIKQITTSLHVRCGDKTMVKVFSDDPKLAASSSTIGFADILYNEKSGTALIKEKRCSMYHLIGYTNIVSAEPHPSDADALWLDWSQNTDSALKEEKIGQAARPHKADSVVRN